MPHIIVNLPRNTVALLKRCKMDLIILLFQQILLPFLHRKAKFRRRILQMDDLLRQR